MYRSYSYSNMPQPKNTFTEKEKSAAVQLPPQTSPLPTQVKKPEQVPLTSTERSLPFGLKTDDLILIAIICALLINRCDDKLLLLALAYIFFSDYYG